MAGFIDKFAGYCRGSRELAWLISVNVGIFILVWLITLIGHAFGLEGNFTREWLSVPADVSTAFTRLWTVATYMVTQYDFIHLLFNMLWLYWFGLILPEWFEKGSLMKIYIIGGVIGAVAYIFVNTLLPSISPYGATLCGASASVLAVMTVAGICSGDHEMYLFLFGAVKAKWVCLVCILLTFIGLGGGLGAAQAAHLGGVVYGIFYGITRRYSCEKEIKLLNDILPAISRLVHNAPAAKRDGQAVVDAFNERMADTTRLDALLDKIRLSGYASLTIGERNELNALSRRIDKSKEK